MDLGLIKETKESDVEARAARIADPATPLKIKYDTANELREMVDSIRDVEAAKIFPHMLSVLLNALRDTEPSFKRESHEFQFRRVLIEILHRIPPTDAFRLYTSQLMTMILHVLKFDNEDNAVTCLKTLHDVARVVKGLPEESISELFTIFRQMLSGMPSLVNEYLSEDSRQIDPNAIFPGTRSFKVLTEIPFIVVVLVQSYRHLVQPVLPEILTATLDAVALESPIQRHTREEFEAKVGIWAGESPNMKNCKVYHDFIVAQIKLINFVTFLLRTQPDAYGRDNRGDDISVYCVRLLQDCPAQMTNARKELLGVLRHQVNSPYRRAFLPHIEKLLNERLILGSSVGMQENMRFQPYATVFELTSNLRESLSNEQLERIVQTFSNWFLSSTFPLSVQIALVRMIYSLTETIVQKLSQADASAALTAVLHCYANKLFSVDLVFQDVGERQEASKESSEDDEKMDVSTIERDRPVSNAYYATENPTDVLRELRILTRYTLHAIKQCIVSLKNLNAPLPDGEVMIPLFELCIRVLPFFESTDFKEEKDALDALAGILQELDLHVFQELWSQRLDAYFKAVVKRPSLLHLTQVLFAQPRISQTVVSTTLRYLSEKLDELGEYDDASAAIILRFFKMTFTIVGMQPELNEPILAQHLGRLIMDSFPLAAKASRPIYYFHLMRALFRAIGGGAGRYEALYREVLPLLPDMLDCLNRQLMAADAQTRDLLVELCLTVPLRLTHLLPHLHYLMKPLVLALQGAPELVSQGLRTLELCIDNLIGDFLDPILRPVLRELMEALHSHLKPLPGNHIHSHTTIRILGKLGGRNRRLLDEKPSLSYKPYADPAKIAVSFSGRQEYIDVGPIADLSARILAKSGTADKIHAYNYLEHTLTHLLNEGLEGRDRETIFVRGIEGLFDAIHVPHVQERAEEYLRTLSRHVFTLEARRALAKDVTLRRFPSHMFGLYLDAFPHALSRSDEQQAKKAAGVVKMIVHDLVPIGHANGLKSLDLMPILHMVATRFSTLCFDEAWVRKTAGCTGMMIMTSTPEVGEKWTNAREIDIVRTLLHVLKDSPHDPPRNVSEIIDNLVTVLKMTNSNSGNQMEVDGAPPPAQPKIPFLIGIFFNEVASSHPLVRQTARSCIKLLSELSGRPIVELLLPHRDRVMTSIFVKPLRSLPHPIIVGQVEAVRYCISLDPPLLEMNDELIRLLHEALALADNSDISLVSKVDVRKSSLEVIQLRVACLKLLTAALPLTDCFSRVPHTRQRVTGVYFKSLYNTSKEVSDAAHEGLRIILVDQSRFPKDLLQTGLRPILMNLSDTKKLSSTDLDGLARLLKLLANYFKVEIGVKLLDHFRTIADPQNLLGSSRVPLSENDAIGKLVRLVNIFHLLPQTAVMYMKDLVSIVVQTETYLHSSTQSPFSEPLGKYLDRSPTEAVDYFLSCINLPRHIRTLRNVLASGTAPRLFREFTARAWVISRLCFRSTNADAVMPGLLLCKDISDQMPGWTRDNGVIDALLDLWSREPHDAVGWNKDSQSRIQKYELMISLFMKAMVESPRIDILFGIISIYSMNVAMDLSELTRFLYKRVALEGSLIYRRCIFTRFLAWFDDQSVLLSSKTNFLRYIITPTIFVYLSRQEEEGLLDRYSIDRFHSKLWSDGAVNALTYADDLYKIEVFHLTTTLVRFRPQLLYDVKKDVIKLAWSHINSEDQIVKQVANLLASRFFEAYETPAKFILSAWTGLLKPPHADGTQRLVKQALDTIAPILQKLPPDTQWARTTRRLLAEEGNGNSQVSVIYQLISRQPDLFYPYRQLFIPHIINTLPKLGTQLSASSEGRILSLDILDVLYRWEQRSLNESAMTLATPLGFREGVVSYLTRIATGPQDAQTKTNVVARALSLLKDFLSISGWNDVSFKLDYFRKALCELDYKEETAPVIYASARVLQVVCVNKPDQWFMYNAKVLQKLMQKGMLVDDAALIEALHPIVERLLRIYPLPKDDEDNQSEVAEFHTFVYNTISEGLKNMTSLRGALLMLKSVVEITPERIEPFASPLMRLLGKLAKEHISSASIPDNNDSIVRMLISILGICQNPSLLPSDSRRIYLGNLIILVEKSPSPILCQYLLDIAREWALHRRDAYPTMKEKASLLQKMATFETRGSDLFNQYLELIYEIYTEPSLRRSDLTSRLEQSFILGCRSHDTSLRERFIDLLDSSIPRSLTSRLTYILGVQSWEALADCNWIYLALDLLLSSVDAEMPLTSTPSVVFTQTSSPLVQTIANSRIRDIVRPMRRLLYYGTQAAHDTWISVFSAIWSTLTRKEQGEMTHHLVVLLSREYHIRQSEMRPNVIQALLEGVHACSPPMSLPAHLLKYLAKTFGAWHVVMEHLQCSLEFVRDDDGTVRDSIYDALAEVYAELVEEDMFYGLWRRRSWHHETNVDITYEQNGMWLEAQVAYEQAQQKARNGLIPFTESEYCLWEDHWIIATEKLQQWDVLYDLARQDGNNELLLEAAWRCKDWSEKDVLQQIEEQLQNMVDVGTPRRRIYEAFVALVKNPTVIDRNSDFTRILEDASQLSLRKWISLPPKMSACHIPLLQHFQQFVELQEAVQIFSSLSMTTAQNLERKSGELKLILQAWRERLPNLHDDISVWSDLVAWRQNVFHFINKHYIPLIQASGQNGAQANAASTFGYRGYHETAWIINRFAHVARKHDLFDVAQTSLSKIYELPNIEISEAFLKLREEARCRLQVPEKLADGLNLINNTNLMYFSSNQKAEFYFLKGMFYSALNQNEDAETCFSQAITIDMNVAKAWAEWGRFNDRLFSANPQEVGYGAHALTCYVQAAGLLKNNKSRPLLTRVLWLLTIDDASGTIASAFNAYNGDRALWYWITLIPQLLFSLSFGEAPQAQKILVDLAKAYPQALFFHLRTTKEDLAALRKQAQETTRAAMQANQSPSLAGQNATPDGNVVGTSAPPESQPVMNGARKEDWELVDDIASLLKTNNPLLALTLETMVDQFSVKFKSTAEEEIYRFTFMLLQDAVQNCSSRASNPSDDGVLSEHIIKNISRMAVHLAGQARKDYDDDFLNSKPRLPEYIQRLQHWRDRYERFLDSRPRVQPLDLLSHWLVEFQYTKFDEVEVPGQYLELVDSNAQFSRIRQFGPKFEICRGQGYCYKRFMIHGHDGVKYTFAVQQPAARWCRREERVMQLFRTFNHALTRRKESRKRNLQFHLPLAVSLNPQVRLVLNDPSYVSLQDIYDQHCEEMNIPREEPALLVASRTRAIIKDMQTPPPKNDHLGIRKSVLDEVSKKMVPENVLTKYMTRTMCGPMELWRMRKAFTLQLAGVSFMSFVVCITSRQPGRFHISRATGQVYMSEVLPGVNNQTATITHMESVPFRFTPNMQHFVNPIGTEALFCPGVVAIARALTKPEYELDQHLCLFVRDEVLTWSAARGKRTPMQDSVFRMRVAENIGGIVARAELMACKLEKNQDPKDDKLTQSMQSVVNLIARATDPIKLAGMTDLYCPWF